MEKGWELGGGSDRSDRSDDVRRIIPKHGGYQQLHSFHAALEVYDATVVFCNRFISRKSRTHDQMVQAARSGVQNIVEGSMASGTSKKTEMKLTNVARASLEELLRDFQDFLRQQSLPIWEKDSPQALEVRGRWKEKPDPEWIHNATPEAAANTLICMIHQAGYLLHRQLQQLETDFRENGGFTENLHAARSEARTAPESTAPSCPECGKPMVKRVAKNGSHAGKAFWGCSRYPSCKKTIPIPTESAREDE